MLGVEHPSSSAVQREAEAGIVDAAAAALGLELLRDRQVTSIPVGKRAHVEVDAATRDQSTVIEAYARQGALKGAQLKKIAQDVLKLAVVKAVREPADTRAVIVVASDEARRSITGWLREAADRFEVRLITVDIPSDLREKIIRAQSRQVMVNAIDVADDVVLDSENRLMSCRSSSRRGARRTVDTRAKTRSHSPRTWIATARLSSINRSDRPGYGWSSSGRPPAVLHAIDVTYRFGCVCHR